MNAATVFGGWLLGGCEGFYLSFLQRVIVDPDVVNEAIETAAFLFGVLADEQVEVVPANSVGPRHGGVELTVDVEIHGIAVVNAGQVMPFGGRHLGLAIDGGAVPVTDGEVESAFLV